MPSIGHSLIKRLPIGILLIVALSGGNCNTEPEIIEPGPVVNDWADEFDGPAGSPPNPENWSFDIGTGWGNEQLECDTDRTKNVALDGNGNLAITAHREQYGGCEYTSARITTQNKLSAAYGRFEARIRLPVGQGIWPAFWLLGGDFATVGWPECGEIDIMEYRGQYPTTVIGSVHGPGYSGGGAKSGVYTMADQGLNEDFHVFAIDWDADSITWYVDDVAYHNVTRNSLPVGTDWVFDHSFFIILNVAVGGHFVGPPDATTVFPQSMLVDWVRIRGSQA